MNQENEEEWKIKYKNLKEKYEELKKIRIESVKEDIKDLQNKIEEHRKVHEISVRELIQQNKDLQQSIDQAEKLKAWNNAARQKLQEHDLILKYFLPYKKAVIECIGHHAYQITIKGNLGPNRNEFIQFNICKENDKFSYNPQYCPKSIESKHQFLKGYFDFESFKMESFVSLLFGIFD